MTGKVIWFTGLSGAGKSTIAKVVHKLLRSRSVPCALLDGDDIRTALGTTGFSKADRDAHVLRVGRLAALLADQGHVVLCALISPYAEARAQVRAMNEGRFSEVFVSCTVDECIKRDPKGLYNRAITGEILNFTGISDPYEEPKMAELTLDTTQMSLADEISVVMRVIVGNEDYSI